MTQTPGDVRERARRLARRGMTDGLPPLLAMCSGWLLIATRVPANFGLAFSPATFDRQDSGQYLSIARYGYRLRRHCYHGHHTSLPGVHLCANVTWFPGYPLAVRALSVTGLGVHTAGLVIAWLCWYLTLLMIWLLTAPDLQRQRSPWSVLTRWLCLMLAAFFPGQIYFAAVFPISMATFGMLACCYWSARAPNRPLAAVAGLIAGAAYLPTVAMIPGLAVAAAMIHDRRRQTAMGLAAGGIAAGIAAVFIYAQVSVGHWNAYFTTEKSEYGVHLQNPLATIVARFGTFVPLPASAPHRTVGEQAFLVALLLALALVGFVVCARSGLEAADVILGIATVLVWLIPYVGGGRISVYRAESLMIILVPLLRRLPAWLLVVPLAAGIWVAAAMAPLFSSHRLA